MRFSVPSSHPASVRAAFASRCNKHDTKITTRRLTGLATESTITGCALVATRLQLEFAGNRSQSLQSNGAGCRNLDQRGWFPLVPIEKEFRDSATSHPFPGNNGQRRRIPGSHLSGRRDRKAREQALVAAAAKLFASRGYDLTTTREIAKLAGCSEGLIHRYFRGKAGLLFALIQSRVAGEVEDLNLRVSRAGTLEREFLQLVSWEVDRMWQDRDFLRIIVPRALLDPSQGKILARVGASRHQPAITERLARFPQCRRLRKADLADLAEFIKALGMVYGFMQPMVLRHNRSQAKRSAANIAKLLACRL